MENEEKVTKRNLWMYPLGTVGRDAIYQLFANFLLTFVLFTRNLTAGQLAAITGIMIAARVFDAVNDPIMGVIIEKTKTRYGKFKPWLALGVALTAVVVITIFNSPLNGWAFVVEFGIVYFLYSITYTMHDISYWGMIPSLSSDADKRNQFTSRAVLFAGVGGTLLSMLVPIFTTGSNTIGGSTPKAYGIISIVVCVIAIIFICFTIFGVKEMVTPVVEEKKEKVGIKTIVRTIKNNKPLAWIILAFLLQQIGNGMIMGGIGSTYVYFAYGYEGGLYSTFSTIGVAATAVLMVVFPMISRVLKRKKLMSIMMIASTVGYALMALTLAPIPSGINFWILTIGYMVGNFGAYSFYLIMMISILNTVEYNEYTMGERNEAIITSVRPFITKLASALIIGITSVSYLIFNVTDYTNQISALEQQANQNLITEAEKIEQIGQVIANIQGAQKIGLLLVMVLISFVTMLISYLIYKKKYTIDEEEYERICKELEARKAN